jgi:hypothetical protein
MTGSDRTPEVPVVIAGAGPAGLVAAATASTCPAPRAGGVFVPNGPATAGCTAGPGTRSTSGWRTTPMPASAASSGPRPASATCRSGSWPWARSRSRPRSPNATGRPALPGRRRRPAHDPSHREGHEHGRRRGSRPYLPTRLWGEVTWAAVQGQATSLGDWLGLLAYGVKTACSRVLLASGSLVEVGQDGQHAAVVAARGWQAELGE